MALARVARDESALAFALDCRASAILGPDTIAESLEVATELCAVAERNSDFERLAHGRFHRAIALLLLGDVATATGEIRAGERVVDLLKQPAQQWLFTALRTMLAIAAGDLADAEARIEAAWELGRRSIPGLVIPIYWMQLFELAELRGDARALEEPVAALAGSEPSRPVFRCALAKLRAELGESGAAGRELRELTADGLAILPFDLEWLYAVSMLAEAAVLVGDEAAAGAIYEALLPWSSLNTVDPSEGMRGSVARYLGVLAAADARLDDALAHFDEAIAVNERMGVRPWLAYTHLDAAAVLRRRRLQGDAERADRHAAAGEAALRELGLPPSTAVATALARLPRPLGSTR